MFATELGGIVRRLPAFEAEWLCDRLALLVGRRVITSGTPAELGTQVAAPQRITNRAAAAELLISEATVKTHLLHIYAKLGVSDRAAAVAAGHEGGLLTQYSP